MNNKTDLGLLLAEQRRRGVEGRLLADSGAAWQRRRHGERTTLCLTAAAVVVAAAINIGMAMQRSSGPTVYCDGSRAVALADADRLMAAIREEAVI